ncbi:restriction endonuclease subunit S [Bacillus sp. I-2]|uniref:restriction endonuclease subunit S n=1 Tax=Bacillus sp. I-2 TaxID=1857572 RepID=UPI000977B7EE|nr:restriction endonuclease subunit S [Bacillus sp. I-2]OMP27750.1 S-CspCI protein [Bacillus sp. I-2]
MIRISDLFDVKYGLNMELNKLTVKEKHEENTVNFVSRTAKNNGVSAIVEKIEGIEPLEAGLITVSGGGSVLETFVQPSPFYSGRDLYYLRPKIEMSLKEKIFYCLAIKENKYRYNYGRQANRTLKDILIPDSVPEWVQSVNLDSFVIYKDSLVKEEMSLVDKQWKEFLYTDIFDVKKGKRVVKNNLKSGDTPFIASIDSNNGIREYCDLPPLYEGNVITVNYNGSVGEAFYQPSPFWASDDVNVLIPKFELNPYIAMFIITIIKQEKYRFNYGRKWHKERMEVSKMKLPVKGNGTPDWEYMERYIKSLPYSKTL